MVESTGYVEPKRLWWLRVRAGRGVVPAGPHSSAPRRRRPGRRIRGPVGPGAGSEPPSGHRPDRRRRRSGAPHPAEVGVRPPAICDLRVAVCAGRSLDPTIDVRRAHGPGSVRDQNDDHALAGGQARQRKKSSQKASHTGRKSVSGSAIHSVSSPCQKAMSCRAAIAGSGFQPSAEPMVSSATLVRSAK